MFDRHADRRKGIAAYTWVPWRSDRRKRQDGLSDAQSHPPPEQGPFVRRPDDVTPGTPVGDARAAVVTGLSLRAATRAAEA
ncbi:hypothetical protein B9J07_25750 [Sinorhizobium sp. LM21]|nr:hypothetical protein B9J07_25750 [Sinorhizobium sp. LM21]